MGNRYCKSIPSEIYFTKEGDWYGGPYVHPPKGKVQLIVCKIMDVSVKSTVKKTPTVDKSVLDVDLQILKKWLISEEGKMILRNKMNQISEVEKVINAMSDISIEDLRRPFDI